MKNRTLSLIVSAPSDNVFNFLSDIENLPKWAHGFCDRVEQRDGRWRAMTSRGELICETAADAQAGTIDLRAGPTPENMTCFPLRVVALPHVGALVMAMFPQPSGLADDRYEEKYQTLIEEMRGLAARFGGGTVHAA